MKAVILLLAGAAGLHAQFVDGAVFDALTGAPLPGASVSIVGANSPVVRTDAGGHFRLQLQTNYSPNVTAARAGYLPIGGTPPGRNSGTMRIELKPEAVIAGKVQDEDGFPAGGAFLQAVRYQVANGRRTLVSAGQGQSDEQGVYRIENLAAGRYYIRVYSSDAANWDRRYVSQYLGGALQPDDSHTVEVKIGETRKDTDIRLVRYEGVTVSGRVEGVAANPRVSGPFVALSSDDGMPGNAFQTFSRGSDMTFTIRHVPPGTYQLRYGSSNPHAGDLSAQLTVEVADRDIRDLVVNPHVVEAIDLEGQLVQREGGSPGMWIVYLRPRMGPGVSVHTDEDGSFVAKGLLPEHYTLQAMVDPRTRQGNVATPPGSMVSATLGDRDVMQNGFDLDGTPQKPLHIAVSKQYASVTGAIVDPQGAPIANTTVYFRTAEPIREGFAATNDKGFFQAWLVEAGDYNVYVGIDPSEVYAGGEADYLKAHQADFPVLHVVLGDNPPVTLVRNPRPGQ